MLIAAFSQHCTATMSKWAVRWKGRKNTRVGDVAANKPSATVAESAALICEQVYALLLREHVAQRLDERLAVVVVAPRTARARLAGTRTWLELVTRLA
jgi:hypothetical protein